MFSQNLKWRQENGRWEERVVGGGGGGKVEPGIRNVSENGVLADLCALQHLGPCDMSTNQTVSPGLKGGIWGEVGGVTWLHVGVRGGGG
jgi:hypothetical protein